MKERTKLNIVIENITEAQACAIEDMLALWVWLGKNDASRWTAFYADGSGDFQPVIKVEGNEATRFPEDIGVRWGKVAFILADGLGQPDEMYLLDYEKIDRALSKQESHEYFED